MAVAPDPDTIDERAEEEGQRRLSMSALDTVMTSFIAGVTIVSGIVALGVTAALVEPQLGRELGALAGALAFGTGLVYVVVGRTELVSENFFDPVAAAITNDGGKPWGRLLSLWGVTFVLNLVGGAVLLAVMLVDGALPSHSGEVLVRVAEEIVAKAPLATLARAVLAGALIALLSYLLNDVNTVTARILLAYMVGVFLALGPFDHVIVSGLHVLYGVWSSETVGYTDLLRNLALATAGNVLGAVLLITLTHTAQVKSQG